MCIKISIAVASNLKERDSSTELSEKKKPNTVGVSRSNTVTKPSEPFVYPSISEREKLDPLQHANKVERAIRTFLEREAGSFGLMTPISESDLWRRLMAVVGSYSNEDNLFHPLWKMSKNSGKTSNVSSVIRFIRTRLAIDDPQVLALLYLTPETGATTRVIQSELQSGAFRTSNRLISLLPKPTKVFFGTVKPIVNGKRKHDATRSNAHCAASNASSSSSSTERGESKQQPADGDIDIDSDIGQSDSNSKRRKQSPEVELLPVVLHTCI